jgi:hypothetical protein
LVEENDMRQSSIWFLLLATALLCWLVLISLQGCAADDSARMRVQAEGTQFNHDRAHCRPATLDRAQPASAPLPC